MFDENCIFCKIIQGSIPSQKVYESERTLAFLDIGPVRPGHALVIPKPHLPTLLDLSAAMTAPEWQGLGDELVEAAGRVARAVMAATGAKGVNLGMNNFAAGGQIVPHAHWHIIPRDEGDGLRLWPQSAYPSPEAMREMAEKIKAQL